MQISNHAYARLRERSGLNKSAAERIASRALERGYHRSQIHGRLRKWVDSKCGEELFDDYVVYGDKLFIFKHRRKVLVTVLQIPADLTKNLKDFIKKQKV